MHFHGNFPRIILDGLQLLRRNMAGWNDAGTVARVDSGQLNMFHDSGHVCVRTVADSVRFTFHGVLKETVNQNWTIRGDTDSGRHVIFHIVLIVHNFHAASAQYEGGAYHDRIADFTGCFQGFLHRGCHSGFRHRNPKLFHHCIELIPIFRLGDHFRRGAEDLNSVSFQVRSQIQRSLPAELSDDPGRLFMTVDGKDILQGQWLKVKFVGNIIIGGHSLRIAVYNNRFKTKLSKGKSRMNAAVVKFDSLPDPVGASAENHNFPAAVTAGRAVGTGLSVCFAGLFISAVVVNTVLCTGYMDGIPGFKGSGIFPRTAHFVLRNSQKLAQIAITETVFLGLNEYIGRRKRSPVFQNILLLVHKLFHLRQEVFPDFRQIINFIDGYALSECFIYEEITLGGGGDQAGDKILSGKLSKVLCMAKSEAPFFQRADSFLKGFLEGSADAHNFADRAHLRAQLIIHPLKLFKGPAGKFDNYVISAGDVLIERSVLPARKVAQRKSCRQFGGYKRDGETGCLGGKRRRTGGAGIDFDDNQPVGDRIVGKLYVGAPDDANVADNPVSLFLHPILQIPGNCQHRSRTETVSGVNSDRIYIFNKADSNHAVIFIADDFQLEFLPAEDRFLNQDLMDEGSLKAAGRYRLQFFFVVYNAAAGSAHGVGRADYNRISKRICYLQSLVNAVGFTASGYVNPDPRHSFLEFNTVFTALNSVCLNTDDLHMIFIQHTAAAEFGAKIETGLAAEIRQQCIRTFLGDDRLNPVGIQRLDVCNVSDLRVRHDGSRIGIDKHNFVAQASQRFAGLCAGIIELTCLANDNRTGSDDQNFMDISSLRHSVSSFWASRSAAGGSRQGRIMISAPFGASFLLSL